MRSSKLPDGAITSAEETRGYQFTNGEYAEFSSISEKEKQLWKIKEKHFTHTSNVERKTI